MLDACVLYPAPLRDLRMHLAVAELFRPRWSDAVHDEWIRSVLRDRPDLRHEQLKRTRALMNAHVLDCVVTGFESLIAGLELPDPADRHVLAAAIVAGAESILTWNTKDFPQEALVPYRLTTRQPDEYLHSLLLARPQEFCNAVNRHRLSLKSPPKSTWEYLATLEQQALHQTVAELSRHQQEL